MQDNSPYSRVIHKNNSDKSDSDLVNSYRFRHPSPQKFRKWSPEASREERSRKKREREDKYVKTLDPEEKPLLVIKQKNLYKDLKSPDLVEDPALKEDFYKVSKNTQVIESLEEQIKMTQDIARKDTVVHQPKEETSEMPTSLNNIYKIEGIEFLPEGFLELEPILHKDQFEFDCQLHEHMFEEEQKRIKALRRKQYEEREMDRKREVTIFVIEEHKDKLMEYLDNWYAVHKRKMNDEEIEQVARILQIESETMARLQDLYLHKKRVINSKILHGHLYSNGKLQDERVQELPEHLKRLFKTAPTENYSFVEPRVYKTNEEYDPVYLKSHTKKMQKNKAKKHGTKYGKHDNNNATTNGINSQELLKFSDNFQNILNGGVFKGTTKALSENDQQSLFSATGKLKRKPGQENDLKAYFDNEINIILEKIKSFQPKEKPKANLPAQTDNQKFIDQYKEKLASFARDPTSSEIIRMESQLNHYNQNPVEYKPYAQTDFVNNPREFGLKGRTTIGSQDTPKLSATSMSKKSTPNGNKKDSIVSKPSGAKKPSVPRLSKPKNDSIANKESMIKRARITQAKEDIDTAALNEVVQPLRVTIVSRNDRGATIISQKLRPSLINNEYIFQTIEDILETNGERTVTVITRNEKGEIIDEKTIDIEDVGNFYHNYVVHEPKLSRMSLIVRNEKGQTISVTPIKNQSVSGNDQIEVVLQKNGERRSTIRTSKLQSEIRKQHKIRPTLIGAEYYNQIVDEVFGADGKAKLTVTTINELGDIVSVTRANPTLIADNYFCEIIADEVEDNGLRKITLATMNNRGETVIQQTFSTSLASLLADQHYTEMLEEVEDQLGRRKITLATKNSRGATEIVQHLRPTLIGEDYYVEILDDIIDKYGKRKITLVTKNNRGETVFEKTYEPSHNTIIGEQFYADLCSDLEREFQFQNRAKTVTKIRPDNQDITLEIYEKFDNKNEVEVIIAAKDPKGEVLIQKVYSLDHDANLGDEYYDAIINDIEDELKARQRDTTVRRATTRVKKSTISRSPNKTKVSEYDQRPITEEELNAQLPRATSVRDNYYRELLTDLGYNKGHYNRGLRYTMQNPLSKKSNLRSKARTANPDYFEGKSKSPLRNTTAVSVYKFSGSRSPTNRSPAPTEVGNRSTKATTVRSKNNTNTSEQESRSKKSTDMNPKNSIPQKQSISHRQTLHDSPHSHYTVVEVNVNKPATQRSFLNENGSLLLTRKGEKGEIVLNHREDEEASVRGSNVRGSKNKEQDYDDESFDNGSRSDDRVSNPKTSLISVRESTKSKRNPTFPSKQSVKNPKEIFPESKLREEIERVLERHKEHFGDEVIRKIEGDIRDKKKGNLIDQFYEFVDHDLPEDDRFKESVMMVSLFYYFLQKKKLLLKK